jgi:hypothetical protein
MSREQFNVESPAFHQDHDSHPRDEYAPAQEQEMYQLWLDRQRATANAAIANAAELTKLAPVTATCVGFNREAWTDEQWEEIQRQGA